MRKPAFSRFHLLTLIVLIALACNLPSGVANTSSPSATQPTANTQPPADISTSAATIAPVPINHVMTPGTTVSASKLVYDVDSSGTAPEKRAPYGDSYDINRFERPFLRDMTYDPNMDIVTFNLSQDDNWYYVSMQLIGSDPNDKLGIDYGVELDTNHDGFGDYIIWAHSPFSSNWDASNVQVYADKNHDTGGLSAEKSDAPFKGDGYETLIFDGGKGDDPDLAWVRAGSGASATLQFAFKKTLAGNSFMYGVVADGGLKNPGMYDYNDRFTEADAGSPIKDKKYYPLKALYAVDNTCWDAFGFKPTGYEPKLCPLPEPKPGASSPSCQNPGQYHDQASCEAAGCRWVLNPNVIAAVIYYCAAP